MKLLWAPLIALIQAITDLVKLQTARYKKYYKMEDKALPIIDRFLDLYPVFEPAMDRLVKTAETLMPEVIQVIDKNQGEIVGLLRTALQEMNNDKETVIDDLDSASRELTCFTHAINGIIELEPAVLAAKRLDKLNKFCAESADIENVMLREFVIEAAHTIYKELCSAE